MTEMIEREYVGLDAASQRVWWRVNGELRLEPAPDPIVILRREVFQAQKAWALKNARIAGRTP